jgi:hypothetical protein
MSDDLASLRSLRLRMGYALGLISVVVGAWLRVMAATLATTLVDWSDAIRAEHDEEVTRAFAEIAWLLMVFGLVVVLVTLHHHFQSGGRAAHTTRGFEPLPPAQ